MCGIAGYIGRGPVDEGRVRQTLALMHRRGPDHAAWVAFDTDGPTVALLHSRLSIIDLGERANQPLSADGCTLVFNGEIYNYLELKERLAREGAVFATASDTEVLLKAYLAWGPACVEEFEGMWAFALWDGRSRRLLLSRDRFGEKPLYWTRTADGLVFGSEVKLLASLAGGWPRVNPRHLMRYLVNGYKSLYKTEETFFEDVFEVRPATSMTITADLSSSESRYWTPTCGAEVDMSREEAVKGFAERLFRSVELRLRADVPLAFMLSGGVDSAALTSVAAKCYGYDVHTFSIIDPDPRYNELANVRSTVDDLGCAHTIIDVPKEGTFERLRQLVAYHDAPVYTISYLVHSHLSEAVSADGYRVAVSGTAADELVTGYYDHFNMYLYEMRDHPGFARALADWEATTGTWVRNPYLTDPRAFFADPGLRDHIYLGRDLYASFLTQPFDEDFSERRFCGSLLRNRMLNELTEEAVPVILHEDDLNSMYYSIENRSPYLDRELVAFSYAIPTEHLIRDGYGKSILRDAVAGILNDDVRLDRQKKGFNASIHSVVDLADPEVRAFLLADGPVFELVRRDNVAELMEVAPMTNSQSKFMFNFINTKLFLEQVGGIA